MERRKELALFDRILIQNTSGKTFCRETPTKGTACAAIAGATRVSQYLNKLGLHKKMKQIIKHES